MSAPYEPVGHLIGPRSERTLFGYNLSSGQLFILGGGGFAAAVILLANSTVLGLVISILVLVFTGLLALIPIHGKPLTFWAPATLLYAVEAPLGRRSWRSRTPEHGGEPELPDELGNIAVIGVGRRGPDSPELGLVHDRDRHWLIGVLRLRLFGVLEDDENRDRKLEAYAKLKNDIARSTSRVRRIQFLARATPQRKADIALYLHEALRRPLDNRSVQAMLQALDSGSQIAQEHEVYLAIAMPDHPADKRPHENDEQRLERAGGDVASELDRIAQRLTAAKIAVKSVDGALTPGALHRMIADGLNPFESAREEQATRGPEKHTGPLAMASEDMWDRVRIDGADHVAWWASDWPSIEIAAGWLRPLLLLEESEAPVVNVSLVFEPIPAAQAKREAEARRTHDLADRQYRIEHQQIEDYGTSIRREKGDRIAYELAHRASAWRYEAFIETAVPVNNDPALALAVRQVESACSRIELELTRRWGLQFATFVNTLPLCRGLR